MFIIGNTIHFAIIISGFVYGLFFFNRNRKIKPIVILLGATLYYEIISRDLNYTRGDWVLPYYLFALTEVSLWTIFFVLTIRNRIVCYIIILSGISFFMFLIIDFFSFKAGVFPTRVGRMESLLLVFGGIALFIEVLDMPTNANIFANPIFLITVAVIWFNVVSLFVLQLHGVNITFQKLSITDLYFVPSCFFYSLILIAILLSKKNG